MTAYEIINSAFGLAGEQLDTFPDKDLTVIWLNTTLAESMDAEKIIRNRKGEADMRQTVKVQRLSDMVNISDCICALALPYGVAAYIFADRADNYMAAIFRNRFITALQNCAKGVETSVTDVYGGDV